MTSHVPQASGPHIIFMAPNWLGDVVMAAPILDLLAGSRFGPDRNPPRVTLAVRRVWQDLFAADSRVQDVLVVERSGSHGGLRGVFALGRDLKRRRADAIVLGPPSLRVAAASALARIPLRCGFRTDGRGLFLNAGLPFPGRGQTHYRDQMLSLARHCVVKLEGTLPGIAQPLPGKGVLPGARHDPVEEALAGPPLWALGVGATYGEAKNWPRAQVLAFADAAVRRYGVRLVLLGSGAPYFETRGKEHFPELEARTGLAGEAGVIDLVGRTSLPQVAGLLRSSRVFVGNDSGLMHLAAGLGTPTVGIFGSSTPDWTAPRGAMTAVITPQGFACSPCFRSTCNQPRFCLETITAESVLAAAGALASGGDNRGKGKA